MTQWLKFNEKWLHIKISLSFWLHRTSNQFKCFFPIIVWLQAKTCMRLDYFKRMNFRIQSFRLCKSIWAIFCCYHYNSINMEKFLLDLLFILHVWRSFSMLYFGHWSLQCYSTIIRYLIAFFGFSRPIALIHIWAQFKFIE